MTLYHYCCSCSARRITARGFLRPHGAQQFGVAMVWLTDQAVPDREGLGLTSHILKCDRLERQYVADVTPAQVQRWLETDVRRRLSRQDGYEAFEEGRQPQTWWVAYEPVFAVRNRRYESSQMVGAVAAPVDQPAPPQFAYDSSSSSGVVSQEPPT